MNELPLRILLLEDSPVDERIIRNELEYNHLDCTVLCVYSKDTFISTMENYSPALILSDYLLSDINGYEALLLAKEKLPHIPFIIITGAVGDDVAVECMKAGADDYILKGNLKRLVPAIKNVLEKYRTKQTLQNSVAFTSQILERVSDGFVSFDNDMNYTYLNRHGAKMLGRTPEDLIGKNYWKEYPEAKGTPFANAYVKALETQEPIIIEDHYMPWDLWFENRIYPSANGLSIFFSDISERKKAESGLRESERYNRTLFNESVIGLALTTLDGKLVDVNSAYANIIGRTIEETRQLTYWELTPEEYFGQEQLQLQSLRETGRYGPYEKEYIHKNGTHVPVRLQGLIIERLGEQFIWSSVENISKKKRDELLLSTEKQILEMIVSNAALPDILEKIVLGIESLSRETIASILLLDSDGVHVHYGAAPHLPKSYNDALEGAPIGPSAGSCGTAMYKKQAVIVSDIETDTLWDDYRELARAHGLRACWSTPIISTDGKTLASFAMYYRTPRVPESDDFRLIERATSLAGIAIERGQGEKALRESEEKFKSIFESANVGKSITLPSGQIYVNKAFCDLLGYTHEELSNTTWQELTPQEEIEPITTILAELLGGERDSARFTKRNIHKNGSYVWADVSVAIRRDNNGKPLHFITTIVDITERKKAEMELQLSEERFSNAFRVSPAGITITRISDGKIVDVNESFLKMFEFTREEVIGHTSIELNILSQEERKKLIQHQIETGGLHNAELNARSKSGKVITVMFSSKPMELEGELHHVTTMIDITERRQAEEALRVNHARLQRVLEVETVGVMFWDLTTGCMTDANDTFLNLMGYSRQDVEAGELNWQKLTPPEYIEASLAEITKFNATGRVGPYEKEYLRKDGTRKWFVFAGSSLGDNACVEFCVDISERKRAEEQLRTAMKQLTEVEEALRKKAAQELHDEVGQNLTGLTINLNFLESQLSPELRAKMGNRLKDSLGLLENTISKIRDIMTELRPSILEDYGLHAALFWFGKQFSERTGIHVEASGNDLRERLPRATEVAMFRVAQEAFNNIAKHSKAKNVNLTLEEYDHHVRLLIRDDGIGFDKNNIPKEKLEQHYGLMSMKERIGLLGGSFEIDSAQGKGTTITIEIKR